ncbi:MAG: hypothetical protein CMA12_04775 [Euryarchaeota archaeon]|nr:hypothetical protein [Euryarchaeota archaeon]|tara:strand:- start:338 stop:664 length:327 start_codon:yes stop_codon:yes gene_type:complete
MVNLASVVLGDFQDSLASAFGSTVGWIVGHLIVVIVISIAALGIREKDHIIKYSGMNMRMATDSFTILILSIAIFWIYTTSFGFGAGPSIALAATTSLSLRWMVTILG